MRRFAQALDPVTLEAKYLPAEDSQVAPLSLSPSVAVALFC